MTPTQRSNRTVADSRATGQPVQERESLVHIFFALATSATIACLAIWTLWPQARNRVQSEGLVLAAESTRALARRALPGDHLPRTRGSQLSATRAPLVAEPSASTLEGASLRRVHGTVVDEFWNPVPYAEVWIDDGKWRVLTLADERGEFTETLDENPDAGPLVEGSGIQLGARANNHGPSRVQPLSSFPADNVRLVLAGHGAGLRIEVRDELGAPLANVQLSLTPTDGDEWEDDASLRLPAPAACSDRWGGLRLDGLAMGEHELRLQKKGFSARTGRVFLEHGGISRRSIEMRATAQLEGHMSRVDGGSVNATRITITSSDGLQELKTMTDPFGEFSLGGLPSGYVQLLASKTCGNGRLFQCRRELFLTPGESAYWDPILSEVQSLSGRLLDDSGQPLVGWRVELRGDDQDSLEALASETDQDGRYELPKPLDTAGASVFFFHPFAGRGIPTRVMPVVDLDGRERPTELEEGEERVARIRGQVVEANGQPAPGTIMVIYRLLDRLSVVVEVNAQGFFETPSLPPGRYLAAFPRVGLGWTPDYKWTVDGLSEVDAGTIALPQTGRLLLQPSSPDRYCELFDLTIELLRPGIHAGYGLPIFQGSVEVPREMVLAPGDYMLNVVEGESRTLIEFHIESGQTTSVVMPATE